MDDLKYWVALTRISGLGPKKFESLIDSFPDLEEAWLAGPERLRAAGLDRSTALRITEERGRIDLDEEMERLEQAGVTVLTRNSPDYPAPLLEIYDPPAVLYVRGNLLEADLRSVAVVGTRQPTAYGREAARTLVEELARSGVTVVSGLARGIDGISHEAALDAGGRTIAVLGSGLDTVYPATHLKLAHRVESSGALISEHPLGVRPDARNFPRRNRIISGLTLGTVVVEAGMRSGALLTVEHAVQQNREVFAVPGSILSENSAGTNWLIQQGAKLTAAARDVLEELNIASAGDQLQLVAAEPESEVERKVLAEIAGEPAHIDDVTRSCGMAASLVASTLAMMELKGLVRQVGAMQYVRVREAQAAYASDH